MSVTSVNASSTPPVTGSGTPSTPVKSAQAAFFRAALSEVQAAAARPTAGQNPDTVSTAEAESPRLPRLGQLVDIRV